MLLSHRSSDCRALDASHAVHAAVHSAYRVHTSRHRNLVAEDALLVRGFARLGAVDRPMITVILAGRACLRVDGQSVWLEPGDAALLGRKGSVLMRCDRDESGAYEHLNVEWTPGTIGDGLAPALATGRVGEVDLRRLREVAGCLARADDAAAAADEVARFMAILRANGLPMRPMTARDLVEPVPEQTRRLLRALDRLLSDIGGQPMAVDLAALTSLSSRQLNRAVAVLNARYGFNATTWRDARGRRRLMMGVAMMTAPGATTERVARAVGFRSAAAFCRALADVGLPAPGEVARAVRLLA
jgi:hypothetical protein